jgi:GTP cyclohydrolase FolE2
MEPLITAGMPDLHAGMPAVRLPVESVGHTGVKRFITIGEEHQPAMVVMDILVGLAAEQRGAHMSRLIQCTSVPTAVTDLRTYVDSVFEGLCAVTPDTPSRAVKARAAMTLPVEGGLKPVEEICEMAVGPDQAPTVTWGLAFRVCLACPQAQAVIAYDRDDMADAGNHPSHNQVCDLEITITGDAGTVTGQSAAELLSLGEQSASGPVREYHKRRSEADVVAAAHRNAVFAEDVLREITAKVRAQCPEAIQIRTQIVNYESIFEYPLRCVVVG